MKTTIAWALVRKSAGIRLLSQMEPTIKNKVITIPFRGREANAGQRDLDNDKIERATHHAIKPIRIDPLIPTRSRIPGRINDRAASGNCANVKLGRSQVRGKPSSVNKRGVP